MARSRWAARCASSPSSRASRRSSGQVHVVGLRHRAWLFNELVEGVVNVPLVPDTLALRASAFYEFDDGYFDKGLGPETAPPTAILTHVGSMKYYGGQIALRFEPLRDSPSPRGSCTSGPTQDGVPVRLRHGQQSRAARGLQSQSGRHRQMVAGEPHDQLHGAVRQLRVLDRLLRSQDLRDRGRHRRDAVLPRHCQPDCEPHHARKGPAALRAGSPLFLHVLRDPCS